MASLADTFDSIRADGINFHVDGPPAWSQGRTLYGGMTAALCFEAARRLIDSDVPLRSMQIAFVGPAAGTIALSPSILRQGRSSIMVAVDALAESGAAARSTFVFGAPRDSAIAYDFDQFPEVPPPDQCTSLFPEGSPPVSFAANFDVRLAAGQRPFSGGAPHFTLWTRFRDPQPVHPVAALLALADSPPPAAMTLFTDRAPISTSTWSLDLAYVPQAIDGWHLLRSVGEQAADGYAIQQMTMWDADGRRLAQGRQSVSIFT